MKIILPFMAGILAGGVIPLYLSLLLLMLSFFLVVALQQVTLKYTHRWLPGLFLLFCLGATGSLLRANVERQLDQTEAMAGKAIIINGYVFEITERKTDRTKVVLSIKGWEGDSLPFRPCKVIAQIRHTPAGRNIIKEGDRLIAKARLMPINPPVNPCQFDYKRLMHHRGIVLQTTLREDEYVFTGMHLTLRILASRLREKAEQVYGNAGLTDQELGVIKALTLGYKKEISPMLTEWYAKSGVVHVLAVSGLHVGIIYMVSLFLLKLIPGLRDQKKAQFILIVLILWIFAFVAGLRPSVLRAAFMFTAIQAGNSFRRRAGIYNVIAFTAFIMMLFNPLIIYDIGFQLSFTAVIGIVAVQPILYRLWAVKNPVGDKIWALATVSIAAQLFTSPFSIFYFNQFPTLFLLANLVVIPMVTIIVYFSVLLLISSPFQSILMAIGFLVDILIKTMNGVTGWIGQLPFAVLTGIYINGFEVMLLLFMASMLPLLLKKFRLTVLNLTLGALLAFMISQGVRQLETVNRSELIVFSHYHKTKILLRSGNHAALLYSDTAMVTPETASYIKKYLIQERIKLLEMINLNQPFKLPEPSGNIWLKDEGWAIFFACGSINGAYLRDGIPRVHKSGPRLGVDVVIAPSWQNLDTGNLNSFFVFDRFIVDSSRRLKKWERHQPPKELAGVIHDVRVKGAFRLDKFSDQR